MFIWDFIADSVLGQVFDWIFSKIVGFLNDFFTMMNGMGVELFDFIWVQSIVQFFSYFGWALFTVGLVVSVFETAMEYESGRTTAVREMAFGTIQGFLCVSLFTTVPIELYKLSIDLQASLSAEISSQAHTNGISNMAKMALTAINVIGGFIGLFFLFLLGYSVIKVFFANLKRGGILLIQIAVGSLYMFSVVRGRTDGFFAWCKQVIGLCLTAFLQSTMLTAGLMVFNENMLLGCGLMLSSTEVPRIAQQFGLDTSTRANIMSAVYATQNVVRLSRAFIPSVK